MNKSDPTKGMLHPDIENMTEARKSGAQKLTELLGECWHEWMDTTEVGLRCTCRMICGNLGEHIKKSNPKYLHADEVLIPMREKLGEEKFKEFINSFTSYTDFRGWTTYMPTTDFINNYILNVPALVQKTIEFLEGEK